MNIIAMASSLQPNLTKLEKKLCEYLLDDPDAIIHHSITELSSVSGVSISTIVRFSRKFGFEGFHDFKLALAQEIYQNDNIVLAGAIEKHDSIETIAKKFYSINIKALEQTMSLMDYEEIYKSAKMIAKAKKVNFMGIGYSGIIASDAKYKFMRIGINCDAYTDSHTMVMMSSIMDKDEIVFAISHSGNTNEIVNSLKIAKEVGAKTIGISHSLNSKMMNYADSKLTYASTETKFQTGSVSTKIAQIFVIDLIYTELVRSNINNATDKKIKTTKALDNLFK
jgi:DNA-binding MurR/RpiR family transcriptional regulator